MKTLPFTLVLNFLFVMTILCDNLTAENITATPLTFKRSKFARKHVIANNTQATNSTSRLSTKLSTVKMTRTTPTPVVNVTSTGIPASNPGLNIISSVKKSNMTLNDTRHSVNVTDLSYEGCGIRKNENHPWIVIIEHTPPQFLDSSKLRVRKTLSKGVLIHPKYVLTTISSIHNSHPFWIVSAVRLGDKMTLDISDHNSTSLLNPVKMSIEEVFLHGQKDIAIIKLAHKVNITDYIRPICLPTNSVYNYRELFLHYCKYRSFRRNTRERRVTTEPVSPIAPQDCRIFFTRKHSDISVDTEFCAWDEVGDTCAGDIGSPLFLEINDRNTIVGLKSIATSEREDIQLDTTIPGIYTRVGSYLKWIAAIINAEV